MARQFKQPRFGYISLCHNNHGGDPWKNNRVGTFHCREAYIFFFDSFIHKGKKYFNLWEGNLEILHLTLSGRDKKLLEIWRDPWRKDVIVLVPVASHANIIPINGVPTITPYGLSTLDRRIMARAVDRSRSHSPVNIISIDIGTTTIVGHHFDSSGISLYHTSRKVSSNDRSPPKSFLVEPMLWHKYFF